MDRSVGCSDPSHGEWRRGDTPLILVVEDSDEDYDTAYQAFLRIRMPGDLLRAETGDECIETLHRLSRAGQLPCLVLMDLNTPGGDGRDALQSIKTHAAWKGIPVVILTTSSNPRDRAGCRNAGADGYHVKPFDFREHLALVQRIFYHWLDRPARGHAAEDLT